ncbi:hypothetical protein V8G54_009060 [Vigna mungo]|uniref:PRA1 family protein n=1 Tax=Vigna mungo TaxID=3915 RepID=A0AAQ3NV29_VIGMU
MATTAPPVLPISNSQPAAAGGPGAVLTDAPANNPAFRAFINHLSTSLRHGLDQRRPWAELADRSAFSKPESFSEATLRVRKNFSYFRVNYYAVVSLILAISLLTNPFSLVLLAGLLASWTFLYLFRPSDQPLVILGRTFVVFLTSVGSVLVSALMLGVAAVCLHGAFRVPEDLFLDEQDASQTTGFLSFLRGPAAVATAVPAVSARV